MATTNFNRVVLTANLTQDSELHSTQDGTAVCRLRVASNTRKDVASGQWIDKPNYFDITVIGAQAENAARYLSKGRPVAIDGRLDWRARNAQDGTTHQVVQIIADSVQFLGPQGRTPSPPTTAISHPAPPAAQTTTFRSDLRTAAAREPHCRNHAGSRRE